MSELEKIPLKEMPDYARHDTETGKKAHYAQIVERFQKADCSNPENLLCLIDTIDQMSPQIYEHYRSLQDLFRENIRSLLNRMYEPGGVYRADTEENLRRLVCCLKKGCANKTLLQEKYQDLPIKK